MPNIDRDIYDPLVTDFTACRNRAQAIAANYKNPALKDAIGDISRRAQIGLDRLAAATIIEPMPPPPEPVPIPEPTPEPEPVPVGTVIELGGATTAQQLLNRIAQVPSGPVYIRPISGITSVTATGDFVLTRPDIHVSGVLLSGPVGFETGSDRSSFTNGGMRVFAIHGAHDILVEHNVIDGKGQERMNWIWDAAGKPPKRSHISNNTIRNFYDSDPDAHTEGIYLGYSEDALIEGNHFDENGTTAHIFLTWWGDMQDPSRSYPRRTCIRNNTFGARRGAWYDIDMRAEIPLSSGICIDPAQIASVARPEFVRACP